MSKLNTKAWAKACHEFKKMIDSSKVDYYKDNTKNDYLKTYKDALNKIAMILDNKKIDLLRQGNHKLSMNIFSWSICEGVTCNGGATCKDCNGKNACYAVQAGQQYTNTRNMRMYKLIIILYFLYDKKNQNKFFKAFQNQLADDGAIFKNTFFRLHESGDIFNQEYLQLILKLAKELDGIGKIYTYTKKLKYDDIDKINQENKNINICHSLVKYEEDNKIKYHYNFFDVNNKDKKISQSEFKKLAQVLEYNKKHGIDWNFCSYSIDKIGFSVKMQLFKLFKKYNYKLNYKPCGICTHCMYCSNTLFLKH